MLHALHASSIFVITRRKLKVVCAHPARQRGVICTTVETGKSPVPFYCGRGRERKKWIRESKRRAGKRRRTVTATEEEVNEEKNGGEIREKGAAVVCVCVSASVYVYVCRARVCSVKRRLS